MDVLILMLAVLLPEISMPARPAAALAIANQPAAAMNTFVIIFRQGPRTLTDADKQRRAEETTAWARRHNDAGHKLDPRILARESALRGPERTAVRQPDAWPVTALLFLNARDLNEAAQIAEAHPALRYGADVEVRPWAPPVPVVP
jgi:hypothetical protein